MSRFYGSLCTPKQNLNTYALGIKIAQNTDIA